MTDKEKLELAREGLRRAAVWLIQYAVNHEAKVKHLTDPAAIKSTLAKAKTNRERADDLRARLRATYEGE